MYVCVFNMSNNFIMDLKKKRNKLNNIVGYILNDRYQCTMLSLHIHLYHLSKQITVSNKKNLLKRRYRKETYLDLITDRR